MFANRGARRTAVIVAVSLGGVTTVTSATWAVESPRQPAVQPDHSATSVIPHTSRAAPHAVVSGVVVCTLNVQNPHASTHAVGKVNVVATISCKNSQTGSAAAAAELTLTVQLWRTVCTPSCHAVAWGPPGANTSYARPSVQANSSGPCYPGSYYGTGNGSIVFPPGSLPPTAPVYGPGPQVSVICP